VLLFLPQDEKRKVFGRTLQGLTAILDLEAWIENQLVDLQAIEDHEILLRLLWPVVSGGIHDGTFRKCEKPELLVDLAISWLRGTPFHDIFEYLRANDVKLAAGTQRRELKMNMSLICARAHLHPRAL